MAVAKKNVLRKATRSEAEPAQLPLADQAYEELKIRLITLKYAPGAYLNEARLSDDLRIGRTPMHQAVGRLVHEGLLEMIPRKGLIVKPISIQEVSDIIEARLVNEVLCAGLAAQRMTPNQAAELEDILKRSEELAREGSLQEQMLLDREFHKAIARAAGNAVLAEILRNLHERSLRIWFVSLNNESHAEQVRAEHRGVFEALKSGDRVAAEDAIREHILGFKANISRLI